MVRYTARGGWTIEVIDVDGRPGFRVRRYGHYIGHGHCYSREELTALLAEHDLELADFVVESPDHH